MSTTKRKSEYLNRSGYILYLVLTLLTMWGIISFSLTRYQSGSVNLLSKSSQRSRLETIAHSAANEIWAKARSEMNNPGVMADPDSFYAHFHEVFKQKPELVPPKKNFTRDKIFNEDSLPFANVLAAEITAGRARVKGQSRIFFTRALRGSPSAFCGHIEVIVQARSTFDEKEIVELKERRDFKIVDTRDVLDRYALFVKDFCFDYNRIDPDLVVEGVGPKVCSSIYLGSRFAPDYPAFKRYKEPPALYLDLNFKDDKDLLPLVIDNKLQKLPAGAAEVPSANSKARESSRGKVFWSVPTPIPFKPIYDRGNFTDQDFYSVKILQDGYYKTFVEPSKKTGAEQYSVPGLILDDWKKCGGVYADSKVFRQVVETSVKSWKYIYAYTDVENLWKGTEWTEFARTLQFIGLSEYLNYMKTFYPDKRLSGKMAKLFGAARNVPAIIEGNVYLRFFKLAFFDEFSASITLGGESKDFAMPSIPLTYQNPGSKDRNFLNKEVRVHGIEYELMSREVEEFPANAIFFGDVSVKPAGISKPENYFPYTTIDSISYRYSSPQDFLDDRTIVLANGEKRIDVDGLMFVEKGNLDLSGYRSFSGQGMIWVGFRGDVYLGNLAKAKPSDILKIWAQDGNFIIKSDQPDVKISASLIAMSYFSDPSRNRSSLENRGKLVPNRRGVEIYGNLAVDYLFLADSNYGLPAGKSLKIVHDPYLFAPVYPKWVTLGKVRTIYSQHNEYNRRVIK